MSHWVVHKVLLVLASQPCGCEVCQLVAQARLIVNSVTGELQCTQDVCGGRKKGRGARQLSSSSGLMTKVEATAASVNAMVEESRCLVREPHENSVTFMKEVDVCRDAGQLSCRGWMMWKGVGRTRVGADCPCTCVADTNCCGRQQPPCPMKWLL